MLNAAIFTLMLAFVSVTMGVFLVLTVVCWTVHSVLIKYTRQSILTVSSCEYMAGECNRLVIFLEGRTLVSRNYHSHRSHKIGDLG